MLIENDKTQRQWHQLLDEWHTRAEQFSKDFANAGYEMGLAQSFMRELCDIFGVGWRLIQFEERVTKEEGNGINRIDGFLPGLLLIEMKSAGKNLADARNQAFGYINRIKEEAALKKRTSDQEPRYVLISDFQRLHLYDRNKSETEPDTIELADLRNHIEKFAFLQGYERMVEQRQEEATVKAAEKLAELHDAIKKTGYTGKDLETLLVRLLFCMFAEDTGLFIEPKLFTNLVNGTREDGRDLSGTLDMLFANLNSKERQAATYPELLTFPYVNGKLFERRLDPCYFDIASRKAILSSAAEVDWAQISPAIFGSLFQAIMHFDDDNKAKSKKRREFGAHYTSEKNILKTIEPLFLDTLKNELKACKGDAKKLGAFLGKVRQLRLLDPACGCGNFLVVAYREIRLLEEQALNEVKRGQMSLDMPMCNVNQCYGIEIDPAAAEIATLALWLVDHQMNMRVRQPDGKPYIRLPLTAKANIVCGNALQLDWNSVLKAEECSYIVGNPPFVGAKFMGDPQRSDMLKVCDGIKNFGLLDYVTGWYVKAVAFIKENQTITAAFVSTNSITQGEQVGVLWNWMLKQGVQIHFAHRTFRWSNEGKGVAAVHCVIIGFGLDKPKRRVIFEYPVINDDPQTIKAKNINPYLVDAPNIIIEKRATPVCSVPLMKFGNQPIDGGNFLFNAEERKEFLSQEPHACKWLKRYYGSAEFINNIERWCLWLNGVSSDDLQKMPLVKQRLKSVRDFRLSSDRPATRELAASPTKFAFVSHTDEPYVIVPSVSSERRPFIPTGFMSSDVIARAPRYSVWVMV
ncbi:class I SAM-dependent DNA methyltransferase [Desulfuromonas thiophila]|uniref:class I SAM-dependent DNA methyltransferase n=1 Tax=Desulfuromonas thiophila TaxID=57664 RepID=UPI0024A8CDA9|nr:DNA methyltransferase [Desulfuromonas thiophila]